MIGPQVTSALTSILLIICTNAATWAVTRGLISSGDATSFANALVIVTTTVVSAGITVYKARRVAPAALIQAVNSGDNGVKVVAATSPAQAVDKPLK